MNRTASPRATPNKCLLLLIGLLAITSCGDSDSVATTAPPPPPNVVIFLVDTLRADWTGPGGFEKDVTPFLSELAKSSVVFEQANSAAPWTLPSVTSLFTGKHVAEHSVVHDHMQMADATVTFAQMLQEWGYQTASYHRNPYAGGKWGLQRGFDDSVLMARQTGSAELADFFSSVGHLPFFLYVHNTEPHDPQHARRRFRQAFNPVANEFLKRYADTVSQYRKSTRTDFTQSEPLGTTDNSEKQASWMERLNEDRAKIENLYSVSVLDADDRIGSVIKSLREKGHWDNTLFIMMADHGEEMGDHGGWQHDQSVYQELIHVPLIIRFPHDEFAGQRISAPVSLVDIMPTILDAVNCPLEPPTISGRSLMPLIRDGASFGDEMRVVSIRNNRKKYFKPHKESRGDLNIAVRKGHMKAIFNVEPNTLELYDLESDPGETQNLAEPRAAEAAEFARFAARSYAEMLRRADQAKSNDPNQQSADVLKGLESLGYIGGDSTPEDASN